MGNGAREAGVQGEATHAATIASALPPTRRLADAVRRRVGPEAALGVLLVLWTLVPLAILLAGAKGSFNGAYGLQVDDQMQYLSFVRDAGTHGLIANQFDVVPDPHLFLHPLFLISGALWRLGASIQLAFLAWEPVALVVLFVGFAAYVRRTLGARTVAAGVALALALFFFTPAAPLAHWLGAGATLRFGSLLVGLELFPAAYPWSGTAGTIAIALMPLFLIAVERLLDASRRAPGRSTAWYALWAGAAGLLVAWLHPWQGITLLVIVGGLVAWGRFARRYLLLAVPAALTALPLLYYAALSRTHSSWAQFSHTNDFAHVGKWFVVGLAPALLALPGVPRRRLDVQQRLVRLWPAAALLVYFVLHSGWFYQALAGVTLPLAVLVVQGWRHLRMPRWIVGPGLLAVTVPGMVFLCQQLAAGRADHFFAPGERRALAYLDGSRVPGAVLAPQSIGQAVPAFTGRRTWVGNYQWTPDYGARRALAEALFAGRLPEAQARGVVLGSTARFLLADCRGRADLTRTLGPLVAHVRHIGCATVYELRPPSRQAQTTAVSSPRTGGPTT